MKRFAFASIVLLLSVFMIGCGGKITQLSNSKIYGTKANANAIGTPSYKLINLSVFGSNIPTYSEEVSFGTVAISMLEYADFSIVLARIDNTQNTPITISPYDFKAKTKTNYMLRQINPYYVVEYAIDIANGETEKANSMKVDKEYYVNSYGYSSASGNLTGTTYGNSTYYSGNASGISTTNTTVTERDDPYQSLAKSLSQISAVSEQSFAKDLSKDFLAHSLANDVAQDANTWNYYILCFEKSNEYPVTVSYKDVIYEFSDSGRSIIKY